MVGAQARHGGHRTHLPDQPALCRPHAARVGDARSGRARERRSPLVRAAWRQPRHRVGILRPARTAWHRRCASGARRLAALRQAALARNCAGARSQAKTALARRTRCRRARVRARADPRCRRRTTGSCGAGADRARHASRLPLRQDDLGARQRRPVLRGHGGGDRPGSPRAAGLSRRGGGGSWLFFSRSKDSPPALARP